MPYTSSAASRPLTVLQVIPELETGGAERTTVDIAAALHRAGHRPLVASAGGRMEGELAAAGGELIRLPLATKSPAGMTANAVRLARLIRALRIDLVHARSRAPAWSALLACRGTRTPFVTTYHGIYNERDRLKRFYNSVMVRGEAVIANSAYTGRILQERYRVPSDQIRVIYRGVDLGRFDPAAVSAKRRAALRIAWGVAEGERVVLNLARLTRWKGQSVLLEALARPLLRDMNPVLVLAGDEQGRDGYRAELATQAEQLGLAGRVRIVGHCADVPAAFALADAAVVASVEPEAFGRAAVEAQAMSVPVVATDLGAAAETVLTPPLTAPAERTGWLVPPRDPDALSRALAEALALDGEALSDLHRRARDHAARFSLERMTTATIGIYEELALRTGPGSFASPT